MKVDVTLKKPRLKLREGHQQRVKVWIITVLKRSLAHPSSIGSDFKKCFQIMKEIFPSYKSELNAISYRNNSARESGRSNTTKRKQNDMMDENQTLNDDDSPPLQHNRVSIESGESLIKSGESPNNAPAALAASQNNHVLPESAEFFTIPPTIKVKTTIDSFFAGPTLVTPTESSASCSPTLPTTACSSFSPSIFDSTDADTTMLEEESEAISSSSKSSTKNRSAKGQELIQIAESLNFDARPRFVLKICYSSSAKATTTKELFGTQEISLHTTNRRVTDSMKMMMVYIAIRYLDYNSKNDYTIKEQHQILNAARRLVCYSKGFNEPKGDPRNLERYFDSLDQYSSFNGFTPLPIGPKLQYKTETKVKMIE